ncbi:MAG: Zn-ribbon domain-containing OB-fold protein [Pseudomonadales bacterium]
MISSAIHERFRAACEKHELSLQSCSDCGEKQFYPRVICAACGGKDLSWQAAAGQGTVASFTVVRQAIDPKFSAMVPYVVALIDLQEGPRIMSVVIDAAPEEVGVGDAVVLEFKSWGSDELHPVFRKRASLS